MPEYLAEKTRNMNFESLIGRINQVQDVLQAQAAHAVNLSSVNASHAFCSAS